jgi:hypothetical protein
MTEPLRVRTLVAAIALLPALPAAGESEPPAWAKAYERAVESTARTLLAAAEECAAEKVDEPSRDLIRIALLVGIDPERRSAALAKAPPEPRTTPAAALARPQAKHAKALGGAAAIFKEYAAARRKAGWLDRAWEAETCVSPWLSLGGTRSEEPIREPSLLRFPALAESARMARGERWWNGRWRAAEEIARRDDGREAWDARRILRGDAVEVHSRLDQRGHEPISTRPSRFEGAARRRSWMGRMLGRTAASAVSWFAGRGGGSRRRSRRSPGAIRGGFTRERVASPPRDP